MYDHSYTKQTADSQLKFRKNDGKCLEIGTESKRLQRSAVNQRARVFEVNSAVFHSCDSQQTLCGGR
jgi:hypothetical protein